MGKRIAPGRLSAFQRKISVHGSIVASYTITWVTLMRRSNGMSKTIQIRRRIGIADREDTL